MYREGTTVSELVSFLWVNHDIEVGFRTMRRRLTEWKVKKEALTEYSDALMSRIQTLFCEGMDDRELLRVLLDEGFTATQWGVAQARFKLGLRRRIRNGDEIATGTRRVNDFLLFFFRSFICMYCNAYNVLAGYGPLIGVERIT